MSENGNPSIERLERAKRQLQVVVVLAVCAPVVGGVQGTLVVLSLREQLAAGGENVAAAQRAAQAARDEARQAQRRAEEAVNRIRVEPARVIPVEFLFPTNPYLFPTDQMYRRFPDESQRRMFLDPFDRLNRRIDAIVPPQMLRRFERMQIDLEPVPETSKRNR